MIVAFDGLQPLDAVGPTRSSPGPGRAAAALGRPGGYRVTLASPGGATVRSRERPRAGHFPAARPGRAHRHLGPAGGRGRGRSGRGPAGLHPRRTALPAGGHGVLGRVPRRRGRAAPGRGSRPIGPAPASCRAPTRRSPSTPIRSTSTTGSTGPAPVSPPASTLAGTGPGGPRRRRGPDLARWLVVPPPARWADPVRLAGVGAPAERSAVRRCRRRRGRARWRPPLPRSRRGRGHELRHFAASSPQRWVRREPLR